MNDYAQRFHRLFARYNAEQLNSFRNYNKENPDVYKLFKNLAMKAKASGRERYSADVIINVLRWHCDMQTTGKEFKISNNFRSMYARLLALEHPDFEDFFEFKGMKR